MNSVELKTKWRRGDVSPYMWITFSDIVVAEVIRDLGLDWVAIDAEHSALDLRTIQDLLMGLRDLPVLVRVPGNDPVFIKRVLDMGATGIIVPHIHNAEEARQAVAACKYPPMGIRGTGPRRASRYGLDDSEYFAIANERTMVVIMIETIDVVNDIDAVLKVDGLDGFLFGPVDLSASMGLLPQKEDARVLTAINKVSDKAQSLSMPLISGIAPAIDDDGPYSLGNLLGQGIKIVPLGTDLGILQSGVRSKLQFIRDQSGKS